MDISQTLIPSCQDDRSARHFSSRKSADVVVVGAGIAGLTAAAKLVNNGIKDVVVFEAQDYVGGRAKAVTVDNKPLDLGPMFIHGQKGNPLYQIAKAAGLVIEDGNDDDWRNRPEYFYTSNKEKVPFKKVESFMDYLEDCLEGADQDQKDVTKGALISSFYQQYLEDRPEMDAKEICIHDAALRWFNFYEMINEGTDDLNNLSWWAAQRYLVAEGNWYTRIKGGYSKIIKMLTDLLPGGTIQTETPVTKIEWNAPGDKKCVVHCGNGQAVQANHVVVTVSLACLKAEHSSLFQPRLPSPFISVINSLELGAAGKIFLKWEKPFWPTDVFGLDFLWLDSHPVHLTSDKSKKKTRTGKLWWQDIPGVETVYDHDDTLLVWLLPSQVEVVKSLDVEETKAVLHELLQHFFYDMNVPAPVSMFKSAWLENAYIRGSYSYPTNSIQHSDAEHLSKPIPSPKDPVLLFAGEAYSLEYMSATHGAFITAEWQADHILRARGISKLKSVVDLVDSCH